MRYCEHCKSELKIKLAKRGKSAGKYFWGSTKYPECKFTEDTILYQVPHRDEFNFKKYSSMLIKCPDDIVSDADRHFSLEKTTNSYSNRIGYNMESLDFKMGFNDLDDFHFWIATQAKVINLEFIHYSDFELGSPYERAFNEFVEDINRNENKIISKIVSEQSEIINNSIRLWVDLEDERMKKRKEEKERSEINIKKEMIKQEENNNLRKINATINIFNAIRRKDIKAIIALRKAGADMTHKNENGLDCFEYAKAINDKRLLEALTCELKDEL